MATSEFWERPSSSASAARHVRTKSTGNGPVRRLLGDGRIWMLLDVLTIVCATALAVSIHFHAGLQTLALAAWHGTWMQVRSMGALVVLLFGFATALIVISRQMHLYTPRRLNGILHEQRLSAQACLYSGLLLIAALYLIHADDIPRSLVLIALGLVTVLLSLRRLIYRLMIYRHFERGVGTRNVLVVGTGPEARALRHHLESIRHLGYVFKGFIDYPGSVSRSRIAVAPGDVVGTFDTLFENARKQFVDEIFFTTRCERGVMHKVLERARLQGVDLRVVPDMYDGLAWNSPIEYIGQFPTIPLHSGRVAETGLLLKRGMDILLAILTLAVFAPLLLAIAVAVKLDSHGPVLYFSDRIGKRGRLFRCIKFRTMVRDAEQRRADMMHMNERDGVLFKISNDPRITRLGRFLRKYSLDELPQLVNVLRGDMSIVGPRPPLASEVQEYKLSHLRRLDVMPGITGLWQVQARQDPSFDSYISLDVAYVENWSVWLDVKILLRTIGAVLAGTGT